MDANNFDSRIIDAVENYYHYNPDTLMPLLMMALAAQGKLRSHTEHHEDALVICEIIPEKVMNYDWVRLNPMLRKRIKEAVNEGKKTLCIEGYVDSSLQHIYEIFHHYDTFTVEEEYHHRIGILYHHSSNKASEQAHRQYATICLAETLLEAPEEWLNKCFLELSNYMLVKSGLQPKRPRLSVAYALSTLLDYDGKGKVYNPFAGCAIAAAELNAGANMFADGNENDKLFAVACLLSYGMSGTYENYVQRDSTKWTDAGTFDYVMSTYRGYVGRESAFDFCLNRCFDTLTDKGKFAGIVSPKDIFEKQSEAFKKALNRDWIDTIVLLPFGEVAVLVNAKKDAALKSKVRFFNLTHPMLSSRPLWDVLRNEYYASILRVADVKKKGYLRSLMVKDLPERSGFEIVELRTLVKKMKRKTYSLNRVKKDERVLAYIDRRIAYGLHYHAWMQGIEKKTISSLFAPAYHLTSDCLITSDRGNLEPRKFVAGFGTAYFQDGYSFELLDLCDSDWLIDELNKPYVTKQLHPYGMDEMVPEVITEEQILSLKLYKEVVVDEPEEGDYYNEYEFCSLEERFKRERKKHSLPVGTHFSVHNIEYTIHRYLGAGHFGYAYTALARNTHTGEEKEVVLKELFPYETLYRDGIKWVMDECPKFDIGVASKKFKDEAEIMMKLGTIPDSHIVRAVDFFESPDTETLFYTMPFYAKGSLDDLNKSGFEFEEEMVIRHIVKPLCKALHLAHKEKVLHLDIKPENILIDECGDAMLTDFGVAKQYDEDGCIIDRRGNHGTSCFAAPEMKGTHNAMVKFGSEPDIYALSATIYFLITQKKPIAIQYNSDDDVDLRYYMRERRISGAFIEAIIAGLQAIAPMRPKNAQAFLNLFPGCEYIKL